MKILFPIIFGLAFVGLTVGIIAASAKTKPFVPDYAQEEAERVIAEVKSKYALSQDEEKLKELPKAVCRGPKHSFGIMNPLTVATHTFLIKNEGHAPLVIRGGASSCKCTLSDLTEETIEPGGSHPITLTWNSGHANRKFQQTAIVHCVNDPIHEEIRLTVEGSVRAVLSSTPDEVNFGLLVPEEEEEIQLIVYSQLWDSMEIDRVECSLPFVTGAESDQDYGGMIARGDEVKNATAAKVVKLKFDGNSEPTTLGGRLRIYVRPPEDWAPETLGTVGSSEGESSAEQEEKEEQIESISYPTEEDGTVLLELPVYGKVVRRISLFSPILDALNRQIRLGKVKSDESQGKQWKIIGRIRGEKHPTALKASVSGIPGLTARIEESSSRTSEKSFKVVLELEEEIGPGVYTLDRAGKLKIEAEGMPESDSSMEFDLLLSVLKP